MTWVLVSGAARSIASSAKSRCNDQAAKDSLMMLMLLAVPAVLDFESV